MPRSALILGGTGQIGSAVASRLAVDGWDVTVAARGRRPLADAQRDLGVRFVAFDRGREGLDELVGEADLLVDVIPYEMADADQLVRLGDRVGAIVAISTASVYIDDRGRSLDEASDPTKFPKLPVPIPETQPTVAPGDGTYSAKKVAIERVLLESPRVPTVVVRPCAVYGPGATASREWFFVKRVLDERSRIALAYEGARIFHTTSAENLAELIRLAAQRRVTGIFNCGDPRPPAVVGIGRAVAAALGHEWSEVIFPGPPPSPSVGDTPWTGPTSIVVDMSAAESRLGYRPVRSYDEAVRATCAWLVEATSGRDWRRVLPETVRWLGPHAFDYVDEDRFFASLPGLR